MWKESRRAVLRSKLTGVGARDGHDARLKPPKNICQNWLFKDWVTLNGGKFGLRRVLASRA